MKALLMLFTSTLLLFLSCDNNKYLDNYYSFVTEISLPTNAPMGLAYDGTYLWYSDTQLRTLNKISKDGDILEIIELKYCRITNFDFYNGCIWCINDTTVLYDTTISNYPFCCIYKLSMGGDKLDSLLMNETYPITKPEYIGIAVCDTAILFSSEQGGSSGLYKIDFEREIENRLHYFSLAGLTMHNDTLFAIDKSYAFHDWIVPFDADFEIIKNKAIDIYFNASDLAFAGNDLWVCDVDNNKLVKVK